MTRPVAVGIVLCLGLASPLPAQRAATGAALGELSNALRDVVVLVSPSVVQVRVTAYRADEDGAGLPATRRSTGSGVILSADGYLVTNAHVIEGGRQFVVVVPRPAAPGAPGRSAVRTASLEVPARLVGKDQETDLAVLKVDLTDLTPATLGDSDSLAAGQVVLAFGSPLGLANSVTMGVVSATGRQLRLEDRMVYLQTDTPINPGNSGGPLVDARGRVVGINTLILSQSGGSEGIGFAAPSNIVRHVYEQIRTHRRVRRGEIGVAGVSSWETSIPTARRPRPGFGSATWSCRWTASRWRTAASSTSPSIAGPPGSRWPWKWAEVSSGSRCGCRWWNGRIRRD
jgi:serine protease Do